MSKHFCRHPVLRRFVAFGARQKNRVCCCLSSKRWRALDTAVALIWYTSFGHKLRLRRRDLSDLICNTHSSSSSPPRTFHTISVDRRFQSSQNKSTDGFWGSQFVKCSVRFPLSHLLVRVCYPLFVAPTHTHTRTYIHTCNTTNP